MTTTQKIFFYYIITPIRKGIGVIIITKTGEKMEIKNSTGKKVKLTIGFRNDPEPSYMQDVNNQEEVEISILFDRIVLNEADG